MPAPRILTVAQAAELLQVSTKTLYNWVHIHGFPCLKLGNTIRIREDLLLEWVGQQAMKGETA